MPSWTAEAKFRLLLAIIGLQDAKTPKWEDVSKIMGPEYSPEAVRQQYRKLRGEIDADLKRSKTSTEDEPFSHKKRARCAKQNDTETVDDAPPAKSPRKKVKVAMIEEDGGDEEEVV